MPSARRKPCSACASGSPLSAAVLTRAAASAGLKGTPSPDMHAGKRVPLYMPQSDNLFN